MWNQPTFVNCKISILVDPWGSSRSPRKAYAFSRRYIDDLQRMPAIPGSTWVYFSINTTVAAFRPLSEVLREHIGVAECHLRGWVHCNGLASVAREWATWLFGRLDICGSLSSIRCFKGCFGDNDRVTVHEFMSSDLPGLIHLRIGTTCANANYQESDKRR